MQRIVDGGEPEEGELANAYDRYLFGKMAEVILPKMETALTAALNDAVPPLLKMQGIMGTSVALEQMRRKVDGK